MRTIALDDGILIDRAGQGDTRAFDCLVRKHYPKACRLALHLTKDADDAADIVAEGFVRAFRSIGRFKHGCSFTTWLYRIQKNCFLDLKKKRRVEAVSFADLVCDPTTGEELHQIVDEAPSPFTKAESAIRGEYVQSTMMQLTPTQRQVLTLSFKGDKTYTEMSSELLVPVGTVKSRMNRARVSLGKLFYSDGDPLILEYFG